MRKSTTHALRFSATAVGMAALGMTFAGTASADELGGGLLGGESDSNSSGDADGSAGQEASGLADVDGVQNATGLDALNTFQLPVASHGFRTGADAGNVELPGVSVLNLDKLGGENALPTIGGTDEGNGFAVKSFRTGLEIPGLTGQNLIPLI
jgi:hypothetical protein